MAALIILAIAIAVAWTMVSIHGPLAAVAATVMGKIVIHIITINHPHK